MYSRIICIDDELWVIIEDGVGFPVDAKGMVVDKKSLTEAQRKIYNNNNNKKHHRAHGILVKALPHSEYT
jgi:hypothetical protein